MEMIAHVHLITDSIAYVQSTLQSTARMRLTLQSTGIIAYEFCDDTITKTPYS